MLLQPVSIGCFLLQIVLDPFGFFFFLFTLSMFLLSFEVGLNVDALSRFHSSIYF